MYIHIYTQRYIYIYSKLKLLTYPVSDPRETESLWFIDGKPHDAGKLQEILFCFRYETRQSNQ